MRCRVRGWLVVSLTCAVVGAVLGGLALFRGSGGPVRAADQTVAGAAADASQARTEGGPAFGPATLPDKVPPTVGSVVPLTLSIPAIGVHTSLELLHRTPGGKLAPPRDPRHAGWYTASAVPGDVGPAVIVGHLDSRRGPAVFAKLAALRPGDVVRVTRSDGRTVVFRVTALRRYADTRFPSGQVYGPQPAAALRLITCGGRFDRATRHYLDNLVVFAA